MATVGTQRVTINCNALCAGFKNECAPVIFAVVLIVLLLDTSHASTGLYQRSTRRQRPKGCHLLIHHRDTTPTAQDTNPGLATHQNTHSLPQLVPHMWKCPATLNRWPCEKWYTGLFGSQTQVVPEACITNRRAHIGGTQACSVWVVWLNHDHSASFSLCAVKSYPVPQNNRLTTVQPCLPPNGYSTTEHRLHPNSWRKILSCPWGRHARI